MCRASQVHNPLRKANAVTNPQGYPQGYPQQPQGYPQGYPQQPQQPPMPQYPQQPPMQAPPAAYAPAPGYPPQGYATQYPPLQPYAGHAYPQQPQLPPPPAGTLDDFFDQPGGGAGPSWKFKDKPINTWYIGTVARDITNADIQAQTEPGTGRVLTFKDGRTKFVMVVPMVFAPSQEFPDGQAGWYVKGQARDELARAMSAAGAPQGPPEAGATIRVTLTAHRSTPMGTAFTYQVEYWRPNGVAPVAPAAAPEPVYAPPQQPMFNPNDPAQWQAAQQANPSLGQPPMAQQIPTQQVPPMAQQLPAPMAPQQAPANTPPLDAAQQALLAKLLGQAPPA